tara:strand:+ start:43 stop:750 length:708 start_codon:yes stop_codon:yes gene_type:complete
MASAADLRRYQRRQILQGMTTYGNTGYGSNINLDARSLDRLPGDFLANQEGYVFTTSPYAPSAEYESAGYQGTGSRGSGRGARGSNFYLFKKKPDRMAELRTEQQRLAGIQQETFNKQQADIAKQLKIVQSEKSAVAKMQEDYSNMLIAEAQRKKEAQEQAERDLLAQRKAAQESAQSAAANRLMEGRSPNLQIQPAGDAPRIGGTQQFRRRAVQRGTASPYKGLSKIQSGMVNV